MAATDHPLKQLVSTFPRDFAVWLLGVTIHDIHPVHAELPAEVIAADLVFLVTLAESRTIVLHIEFQGRRSHEPMEWRMLDYMTRLAHTYHLEVWSVVIYVGRGAGAGDTGRHQLNGPDSMPALMWHYHVVRLWQMDAEELLALEQPALLALVGQTRIVTPATILPDVVTRIPQLPDAELRRRASVCGLAP